MTSTNKATTTTSTTSTSSTFSDVRKLSFVSQCFARGTLPDSSKLCDTVINVFMYFAEAPREEDLIPVVKKLFEIERMGEIPMEVDGEWIFPDTSESFEARQMITSTFIECTTGETIQDIISKSMNQSLRDRDLPWWEIRVIHNTSTCSSRSLTGQEGCESLVLFRMDHALGDGMSIGRLFASCLTDFKGQPVQSMVPVSMMRRKTTFSQKKLLMAWRFLNSYWIVNMAIFGRYDDHVFFHTRQINEKGVIEFSGHRSCIMLNSVPLSFIKSLQKAANTTLNDIVMTAISQAIHDFCVHHKCSSISSKGEKVRFRTVTPYAFPYEDTNNTVSIRNKWVGLTIDLGIGIKGIQKRLKHIKKQTDYLKNSPVVFIQKIMQSVVVPLLLPFWMFRLISYRYVTTHSLNCTNVPGPSQEVCFAGRPIKSCGFAASHMSSQFCIFSYNGIVNLTLSADDKALPQVKDFPRFMDRALIKLAGEFHVEVPSDITSRGRSE